ncbi:MAG: hypothetical protein ABEN55_12250 [Bradymonadaceae bacterium]
MGERQKDDEPTTEGCVGATVLFILALVAVVVLVHDCAHYQHCAGVSKNAEEYGECVDRHAWTD